VTETSAARTAGLTIDSSTFVGNFDKRPFYIEHNLQDHPLFELPAIAALAERLPKDVLEWNSEGVGTYENRDQAKAKMTCAETILSVEKQTAWVLLLQVERDPRYRALLDEILDQVPHPNQRERQGFLFVSSRASVTPYHFDPELNFLLQVRGQKTVFMWDADNRFVLPAPAIDAFYAGNRGNRDQPYREDFLPSAWKLPLMAGQGLHFPLHAPHWVKTESDVSISLSVTFKSRQSEFRKRVHGINHYVRKFGIEPPAPGASMLWDVAANAGNYGARKMRKLLTRA